MDNMGKLFVMLFAFLPAGRQGRQVLLHSRQICNGICTRTPAFDEATAGKERICTQLKSRTVTNNCFRNSLYSRVLGTSAFFQLFVPEKIPGRLSNLYPRLRFARTGHGVIALWSCLCGVNGSCPDAASGNTPTLQAGSFAKIAHWAIS